MKIDFTKYHGAGNDFVMINNLTGWLATELMTPDVVARLCRRNFGIGADGLIILTKNPEAEFEMIYFNSDGHPSSMCGNGGRCILDFAYRLGHIGNETSFMASDGLHKGRVDKHQVALEMRPVYQIKKVHQTAWYVNTGSPHHVELVDDLDMDIVTKARSIRYSDLYRDNGTNVNFIKVVSDDALRIRTYERGVEDETLACGTGVTAAALTYDFIHNPNSKRIKIRAEGGDLEVSYRRSAEGWEDIWLYGPAEPVYEGVLEI